MIAACPVLKMRGLEISDRLTIETFDFEDRWTEVISVLDDSSTLRALDVAMTFHCETYDLGQWDSSRGPWAHSHPDFAHVHVDVPHRDTPDWYRCWGACHSICAWCGAIGQLLFPDYEWLVLRGDQHSAAAGLIRIAGRQHVLLMDILWGAYRDPQNIWSIVSRSDRPAVPMAYYIDVLAIAVEELRANRERLLAAVEEEWPCAAEYAPNGNPNLVYDVSW